MPEIDNTNVGIVYADQYSKYENLNTIGDSSIFFIKNHGIYVGQHMVANYINATEIPDSLSDLLSDSTHRVVTDASIDNWNSKQDLISDLDTIRRGAALGTSSLQTHQNIKTVNQQTVTGTGNVSVGTITGITMNGQSKGTIGVVDLGTVLTSETDPVYAASVAAGISSTDITNWNNKLTKTQADEYYVTYDYIGSLNDLTASELNTIFS